MTVEEAIWILYPKTSTGVIYQMREDGMSDNEVMSKINEACVLACEIMKKYLEDNNAS